MKIIIINGQGGCGKDAFVKLCRKHYAYVFSTSMIDGTKEIAKQIGWEGGKSLKDRKFLSDLKDLFGEYNDFPFTYTKETVEDLKELFGDSDKELIIFIHAREPEDIERWVEEYEAITLLIRREEVEGKYGNHADDMVFDIPYDFVIYNNTTLEALEESAETFIENLLSKEESWGQHNYKLP